MGTTDRLHRRSLRRLYRAHIAAHVTRPPQRFGASTAPAHRGEGTDRAEQTYWQVRERTTMRPADFVQLGIADADELGVALRRLARMGSATTDAPVALDGDEELIRATVAIARRLRGRTGAAREVSATTYVMY